MARISTEDDLFPGEGRKIMHRRLIPLRAAAISGAVALACCHTIPAEADGDTNLGSTITSNGPTTTVTVTTPGTVGEQTSYAGQSHDQYQNELDSASANLNPSDKQGLWAACGINVNNTLSPACAPSAAKSPKNPNAVYVSPALLGQQAVLRLTVPSAVPMVGPPPSSNRWEMVAVGYPLWLSVAGPTTLGASITVQGFPVQLTATRTEVDFSMGDGGSVACTSTTPWAVGDTPGAPSPDCGYTYKVASETKEAPHATYRVVATASWSVTWSVLGQSGTIPVQRAAGLDLPVGELQALVTGR